jgi:hypothetical protein
MSVDTEILSEDVLREAHRAGPMKRFAQVVSIIFHPLFVPVYVTLFVLFVHPLLFAAYSYQMKQRMIASIIVNLTALPAITVFLCWRLNFISSMYMNTAKERIIPLAAAMIFYFWGWFVMKNNNDIPEAFKEFLLGSFITIIAGWMANIYYKISLHALAMGGLFCFMLLVLFRTEGASPEYFVLATIIAGLTCSARLVLSSHRPVEVYSGFFIGALSQLVALFV